MNRAKFTGIVKFSALVLALAMSSFAFAKPGDEATKPETPPTAEALDPQPETPQPEKPSAPKTSGDLPWIKKKAKADPLPLIRPPTSVREILEKYEIGESQLTGFFNGEPLSVSEKEVLVRILFRLPRIGLENIEKWRKTDLQLDQLVAGTAAHRLDVVPLKGRLIGIEQRDVTPELAARLEFKHFYLARIDLVDQGYEALVAVRHVPSVWIENAELNEPVSLDGIYLKVADATAEKPQLLFVSRRIRWHPDQPVPEQFIGADQLKLAEWGLDMSLLEDLKLANKKGLGDVDREPFYQLLDLVGRTKAGDLVSSPRRELDIVELLKSPEKHHGEFMSVYGLASRITKIVVNDPDIRARFKIDHYFEIDMSIDLGDKTISFVDDVQEAKKQPNKDENSPTFNNTYPVTLCVRELPLNLKPTDKAQDMIHINAIFMKTWSYRNAYMAKFDNKSQPAPYLIGKIPHRVVLKQVHNWVSDVLVGFALAVAAIIIGSVFWWFRTADQGIRQTHQDLDERGQKPSFAGLENAPTKPDFSGLEVSPPDEPAIGSNPPRT